MTAIKKYLVFHKYRELITPGLLGNYNGCEVYTLFFQKPLATVTYNLFTLINFGVFPASYFSKRPTFPTERIKVKIGGDTYNCGLEYYVRSIDSFTRFYSGFLRKGRWSFGSGMLEQEADTILAKQYVPGEATAETSLNKILKNNFTSGSYLIEHFDVKKQQTAIFREASESLVKISEAISKAVGLRIASVSDRLGNIILQFPSTLVRCDFNPSEDSQSLNLTIKTSPGFNFGHTLKSIAMNECERGKYLHDFAIGNAPLPVGNLSIDQTSGIHCCYLVESTTNTILSSFKGSYIEGIATQINLIQPEPRIVETSSGIKRVQLTSPMRGFSIGTNTSQTKEFWENERIFNEERKELEDAIAFKQYGLPSGHGHKEAANDIETLINKHGKLGAWLWDPFLSAQDILDTLFMCNFQNVELRALSSNHIKKNVKTSVCKPTLFERWKRFLQKLYVRGTSEEATGFEEWKKQENSLLMKLPKQAKVGLHLEFRVQHGSYGYKFHDRFLLFPGKGGRSKVWALGTSINNIGQNHHIIQEVSHPEYIIQAFEKLWSELNVPECLVWKS